MPERHTLNLSKNGSNLQLSYLEWNLESNLESNQKKQPLILLHGLADHALVWLNLGDYLANKYHIIAPDLRGHGESSKPKTGYTFAEIIEDLEAIMEEKKWDKVNVIAHSWSAKLLTIWATKNPTKIEKMILVDPFFIGTISSIFKFTFPILYKVLPFLKAMGPFSSYQEAENLAKTLKQYRGWSDLQKQVFQTGIEEKNDGTWGSKFTTDARDYIFDEVMKVPGLTKEIEIPALFIKPEKGLNRTQWQLQPYYKYLTQLTIKEVPGNHWAHLVKPEEFNLAIAEFLQS